MLCMIYAARWYPPILLWRWKLESVSFLLVCVCAAVGDPFPLSLSRCPGRQFNLLMNHKSLHHSLCQGKRDDRVIKKWEETQSRARVFLSSSHNMQREGIPKNCWCRFAVRRFALHGYCRSSVRVIINCWCCLRSALCGADGDFDMHQNWSLKNCSGLFTPSLTAQVLFILELLL